MRFWSRWDVSLGHHRRYEPDTLAALLALYLAGLPGVRYRRKMPIGTALCAVLSAR